MNQKGFTMVELLTAMSIEAVIILVVVAVIFVTTQGRGRITGKSLAISDIDNATHWITRDLIQAQTTSLIDHASPVSNISITCDDNTSWALSESSVTHSAIYTFNPATNQLQRNYDNNITVVGKHLVSVAFSMSDNLITVTLQSSPSGLWGATASRTYLIHLRPQPAPV